MLIRPTKKTPKTAKVTTRILAYDAGSIFRHGGKILILSNKHPEGLLITKHPEVDHPEGLLIRQCPSIWDGKPTPV